MQLKLEGLICLDLGIKISYQKKKSIIDFLTSNGAKVSFIISKKCKFLVIDDKTNIETYKCRTAFRLKIPIIHIEFFYKLILDNDQKIKIEDYLIQDKLIRNNFTKGIIQIDQEKSIVKNFDLNKIKSYSHENDPCSKEFELKGYQILKWIAFHENNQKSHVILEIHSNGSQFRLLIEITTKKDKTKTSYYTTEGSEVHELFQHLSSRYLTERFYYDKVLPNNSGSLVLQSIYFASLVNSNQVSDDLANFINYIWSESVGQLDYIFKENDKFYGLTNSMLDKAELILYQQRDEFLRPKEERIDFTKKYYASLPFKNSYEKRSLLIKKNLNDQFELIQVLHDMLNIGEETNWNLRSSVQSIYRSIGCHIRSLSNEEYSAVCQKILNSTEFDSNLEIMNIYSINRPNETLNFNKKYLDNVQLLYHGSRVSNFVGILSRGLLTPKNIICQDTARTSDPLEMLGFGIYFSDSIKTSLKYAKASDSKHTQLLLLCEVALGKCKELYEFDYNLIEAPSGYQSVHGVKMTPENGSAFEDSEYCVYEPEQCKLKYLIEVKPKFVSLPKFDGILSNENSQLSEPSVDQIDMTEPKFTETKSTLKSSDGKVLPLKSVHVRAEIIDMVSKVTIFQEYENNESKPIEAEYLFPLVDTATVCNFEAFINDKHVIGVCKEKEIARREYREAVSQGKGAYLIDQETNEIFKVNVGNLPSKAKCVIKITYVSEMDIQNEQIYFRLPSNICQWKVFEERESLQDSVVSRHINRMSAIKKSSFKACVIMPFEIRSIRSYTHAIKIKKTACQAVLEMDKKLTTSDDDTLIIAIEIATIHMPRMFVEEFNDKEENKISRACMVSFYPEFSNDERLSKKEKPVINFIMDCSNSLNENNLIRLSKKLILLMFNYLPKDSLFNVTTFGTDYEDIFPYPFASNSQNLKQAIQCILNKTHANKGNTDLLHFIQNEDQLSLNKNYVLISDGHMTRSSELISYLSKHNRNRIFTCSIGNLTNNNHLLKLIANLTKAHYEFYDDKIQRKWREKIEDLMDKIQQPTALSQIQIDWQNFEKMDEENFDYNYAPNKINCLFNGRRVLAYGFMPNCQQAVLKATINGYEFETLVTCPELMITRGDLIHKLTAKALIDDWQNGILCSEDKIQNDLLKQKLKNKIIRLSKKFSITSEYTSFVAIEDREKNESRSDQVQIKDLLEKSDQSIDILPYMVYETSLVSKDNFILDEIESIDRKKLFEFYLSNDDLVNSDEMRLFMGDECKKLLMLEKALKFYKSCDNKAKIDQLVEELKHFRPQISIKTLTGRTISMEINEGMSLDDVKRFIQDKEGIPIDQQSLYYLTRKLERPLLSDYGISDGSVIYLILRLRGGPAECEQESLKLRNDQRKYNLSKCIRKSAKENKLIKPGEQKEISNWKNEDATKINQKTEVNENYLNRKELSREQEEDFSSSDLEDDNYIIQESMELNNTPSPPSKSFTYGSNFQQQSLPTKSYNLPELFNARDALLSGSKYNIGMEKKKYQNQDRESSPQLSGRKELSRKQEEDFSSFNLEDDNYKIQESMELDNTPSPPPKSFSYGSNFQQESLPTKSYDILELTQNHYIYNDSAGGMLCLNNKSIKYDPLNMRYYRSRVFLDSSKAPELIKPCQPKKRSNWKNEYLTKINQKMEVNENYLNRSGISMKYIKDNKMLIEEEIKCSIDTLEDRSDKLQFFTEKFRETLNVKSKPISNKSKIVLNIDFEKRKFKVIDVLKELNLGELETENFQYLIEISEYKIKFKTYEIDCMPLIDFFVSLGVNSFGEQASREIKELIIDLVILVMLLFIITKEKIKITSFNELEETIRKVIEPMHSQYFEFVNQIFNYLQRVQYLQLKYPNVCDSLELERNWDKFLVNWLLTD